MINRFSFSVIIAGFLLLGCSTSRPTVHTQQPETDALLQAISIVDRETVWLSGHQATFVRTLDGGSSWQIFQHPNIDTLQFRDIYAFDASRIMLMSSGEGPASRIYEVKNGKIWRERFVMDHAEGFLDCMDFWDDKNGIAYGDAIDEYPYILLTDDGGTTWRRAPTADMPKAGEGEGGFAASGTCVSTAVGGVAWIATGAGGNARILKTEDYGKTWQAFETPIIKGDFAGLTSVSQVDDQNLFITGGDLTRQEAYTDNCAFSEDGGKTWTLTRKPKTPGAFYGSARVAGFTFACGPKGLDYTTNSGKKWQQLDTANYWVVELHSSGIGWASGKDGVKKIRF